MLILLRLEGVMLPTRLEKVVTGECVDATILTAADLTQFRLGIESWDNVDFRSFDVNKMVPTVG